MDLNPIVEAVIILAVSGVLSAVVYFTKLLTPSGSIAAFIIGSVIGLCGSIWWLILLIVFAFIGFAATLVGLSKKRAKGLQEGKNGERNYRNILGVALPCCVFALINVFTNGDHYELMTIGYIATIAVAAADTAASELGVKDPNVYLITNFKKVAPGTDGGVSVTGTAVSLAASAVVSVIGWAVIFRSFDDLLVILPIIAGFIGCMLDSLVGATIETKGYISKYGNNCITGIAGGAIAVIIAMFL